VKHHRQAAKLEKDLQSAGEIMKQTRQIPMRRNRLGQLKQGEVLLGLQTFLALAAGSDQFIPLGSDLDSR